MSSLKSEVVINYDDSSITSIIVMDDNTNTEFIKEVNKKLSIFIELMNLNSEKINNIHNDNYDVLEKFYKDKIQSVENKYAEVIDSYKNKIHLLKDEYREEYDMCTINNMKILELEYNSKLDLERYKIAEREKEIEDLKKINNTALANILGLLNTKTDNVEKGIIGEAIVYNYLYDKIKINHEWHIENVSKDGNNSSDISLIYKNLNCVIEVKNIKTNMTESNIKKFNEVYIHNDIKNYNCGIFVSLKSAFGPSTGLHDFSIKSINNKYVIYLANVESNLEKLVIALDVLNYLTNISDNNRDINLIVELISSQIKNYNVVTGDINKAASALKSALTNIKQYKEDIYKFLERKQSIGMDIDTMCEEIDNKFACVICSKSYVNKQGVLDHIRIKHLK